MLVTQVRFWTRPWWKSKWKVQGENATQNCTYINISISASQRYVGYVVIKYKKRKNIKNVSDGLSWVANMVRLMYLPVLQPYSLYPKISRFLFLLLLLFCVLVYVCFFSPFLLLFLLLLLLLFFHFNSFSIFLIRHHPIQNTHKKNKNKFTAKILERCCLCSWLNAFLYGFAGFATVRMKSSQRNETKQSNMTNTIVNAHRRAQLPKKKHHHHLHQCVDI